MTFELTPERLQEIAVGCVTQFMQKTASLNESIAKEAMELELNSDQTKRVIEASNTIAYLRQLEKSADRTFEFEVADYSKVMANMCMPDDMLKAAGKDDDKRVDEDLKRVEEDVKRVKEDQSKDDKDDKKGKGDKKDSKDKDDESEDEDEDEGEDSDEEKQEKKAMLKKAYFQALDTLERMKYDEATLCMALIKAAGVVGKDAHGFEKLSFVVDSANLDKTLKLCGIEKRAAESIIFTNKELQSARDLFGLYKKANEFKLSRDELFDFAARAEEVLFNVPADLEKQAFLGKAMMAVGRAAYKGLEGAGHMVGSMASSGVTKPLGALDKGLQGGRNFAREAKNAGFGSTDSGMKAFDELSKRSGPYAAQAKFNGTKPSLLGQRIGVTGLATFALGATGIDHKNNVKDI